MKKGLAIFLVLTLIASMMVPFSVSATGSLPPNTEVTGQGQPATYQTHGDLLGGVLPTSDTLNFAIDPLGVLGLTAGDSICDAVPNNLIVFGDQKVTDGDVVTAWNLSNIPVVFSVELSFGTAGSTAVFTEADVTDGDTANVLMWVEPSAEMATRGDTFAGLGHVSPFGTAGDTTGGDVRFILDEVAHRYVVIDGPVVGGVIPTERVRAGGPDMHGTALRFGGIINLEADWSDVGSLTLLAVFSMAPACKAAVEAADTPSATIPYGWLESYTTGGEVYTPPTLIPLPEAVETIVDGGLSDEERDAQEAARIADEAADAAFAARDELNIAITARGTAGGTDAALQPAVDKAKEALATAIIARTDGNTAVAAANTADLNAGNPHRAALDSAVARIGDAISALQGRIEVAEGLIGPTVGFVVNGSIVTEAEVTRPSGSGRQWTSIEVDLGTSTIQTVQSGTGAVTAFSAANEWTRIGSSDGRLHVGLNAGGTLDVTYRTSCDTVLVLTVRRP